MRGTTIQSALDNYNKRIGKKLLAARGKRTLESVSKEAELSINTIKAYEKGNVANPALSVIFRLAYIYKVDVEEIIDTGSINPISLHDIDSYKNLYDIIKVIKILNIGIDESENISNIRTGDKNLKEFILRATMTTDNKALISLVESYKDYRFYDGHLLNEAQVKEYQKNKYIYDGIIDGEDYTNEIAALIYKRFDEWERYQQEGGELKKITIDDINEE